MHGHPQWTVTVILLSDLAHFHFSPLLRSLSSTFLALFIHIRKQRINASINWCNADSVVTLDSLSDGRRNWGDTVRVPPTDTTSSVDWLTPWENLCTTAHLQSSSEVRSVERVYKAGKMARQTWVTVEYSQPPYMTQIKLLSVCLSLLRPPHMIGCTVCVCYCVCAFATFCQCLSTTVISNVCIFSLRQCV